MYRGLYLAFLAALFVAENRAECAGRFRNRGCAGGSCANGVCQPAQHAPQPSAPVTPPKGDAKAGDTMPDQAIVIQLELHNKERQRHGLVPLVLDRLLCRDCHSHAVWVNQTGRFEHGSHPNASSENIMWRDNSPHIAIECWMRSTKGHKENILNPRWRSCGFACVNGVWVAQFK